MFEFDELMPDFLSFNGSSPFEQDPPKYQPWSTTTSPTIPASSLEDCGRSSGYGSPTRELLAHADFDYFPDSRRSSSSSAPLIARENSSSSFFNRPPPPIGASNEFGIDFSTPPPQFTKMTPNIALTPGAPPPAIPPPVADGFSADEIRSFDELLRPTKKLPPPNYQCHICYRKGHFILDCPLRALQYRELTPYQGRKTCYGEYQCNLCKRKWTSYNSTANEALSCIKCRVAVFPNKQFPFDKAIARGLVKSASKIRPIG